MQPEGNDLHSLAIRPDIDSCSLVMIYEHTAVALIPCQVEKSDVEKNQPKEAGTRTPRPSRRVEAQRQQQERAEGMPANVKVAYQLVMPAAGTREGVPSDISESSHWPSKVTYMVTNKLRFSSN